MKTPSVPAACAGSVLRAAAVALALVLAAGRSGAQAVPEDPNISPPTGVSAGDGAPNLIAVVGGTLIDGTGAAPVPDSAIIIEGDRVRAAGPRRQVRIPPGARAVDATDFTVIPGLVDMHVHLLEGVEPRQFVAHGVTSVRHLGDTTLERIMDFRRRVDGGDMIGPRIFHCGLFVVSQPPLEPERYPPEQLDRFMIMRSPADAPGVVRRLLDAGADVVKVKTEMSPECLRALCAAAIEAGLPISFDNGGETGSYDAVTALDAGARGVEHLSGIEFEDPAAVEEALKKMLAAGAFADPTFSVLARTYSERRVAAREAFIRRFAAAGGAVVAGTDVPTGGLLPGASLHEELQRLVDAGLTPMQALLAATGAAGRALGYPGLVGTLEAGSYADLVIVYGDPLKEITAADHVSRVFKGGREVYPFSDEKETHHPR